MAGTKLEVSEIQALQEIMRRLSFMDGLMVKRTFGVSFEGILIKLNNMEAEASML